MGRRDDAAGCCAAGEVPLSYEESLELGYRRRTLVIKFSAAGSIALTLAGVLITLVPGSVSGTLVGGRLLWAAALFGIPLVLGDVRQLLATRRLSWRLLGAAGLLAVAFFGFPVVAATATGLALTTRAMNAMKPAKPQTCESNCARECCAPSPMAVAGSARQAG